MQLIYYKLEIMLQFLLMKKVKNDNIDRNERIRKLKNDNIQIEMKG